MLIRIQTGTLINWQKFPSVLDHEHTQGVVLVQETPCVWSCTGTNNPSQDHGELLQELKGVYGCMYMPGWHPSQVTGHTNEGHHHNLEEGLRHLIEEASMELEN